MVKQDSLVAKQDSLVQNQCLAHQLLERSIR